MVGMRDDAEGNGYIFHQRAVSVTKGPLKKIKGQATEDYIIAIIKLFPLLYNGHGILTCPTNFSTRSCTD